MIAIVGWIAAATTAFHLATANLWGYHRDEFYYLACGRRLAWGFVDHPPITPFLYRVADVTVGPSKFGLRIVPAVLHGAGHEDRMPGVHRAGVDRYAAAQPAQSDGTPGAGE